MSDRNKGTPPNCEWLDDSVKPRSVHGYAEAAALLNNPGAIVDYHSFFVAAGASKGRAGEAGKRSLLNLNGEEHKRLRSKIAAGFRPRSVDRVRPFSRETAIELLDKLPSSEPFDFMQGFAKPYIERTTGQYIGFPLCDLGSLDNTLILIAEAVADLNNRAADFDAGCTVLLDYATDALLARRDNPTDDVLGQLAQLIKSGDIDELFAASLVVTLLSAGLEPTIFQIGLLIEEFSKLPSVWNEIASDDSRIPIVLEELLRLRSTNQGVVRRIKEDVMQHEVCFKKGSEVIVDIAGANHDSSRFPRPDVFDPGANSSTHLAFGFGPHHCLGASLVRVQIQEAFQVLAAALHCPVVLNVKAKTGQGIVGPLALMVEIQRR